ncbi:hypothetical protein V162_01284 [Staphylococcus aureus USA_1]|nr:hypothetical protein V162_01284 [Staphylococcus aureus USA_1]
MNNNVLVEIKNLTKIFNKRRIVILSATPIKIHKKCP